MIVGMIAAAILIPLLLALKSDHRGYCAAIEKWKLAVQVDPISAGPRPVFDWDLFRGRMIDAGIAAVLLVVAVVARGDVSGLDRAEIETIVRELYTQIQGGSQ